ncbi:unnamed protein product [Rotaria socialis]|uniref:TRAF1-6 MATH domain-containing protein n=1 Tax=Rotaria socialis TaxID=392032 RepID=A0A819BN73_9BILA|nr:unnamed protein product [Rotaria socialis]
MIPAQSQQEQKQQRIQQTQNLRIRVPTGPIPMDPKKVVKSSTAPNLPTSNSLRGLERDKRSINCFWADTQSERRLSVYSSRFYSSPTDYKIQARLYLNEHGTVRRTPTSLFFIGMRESNDTILKFLLKSHVIDLLRPDIKSNSFQRLRSEMNTTSSLSKFSPLAMI